MKMILTSKIRWVHSIMAQYIRSIGVALLLTVGVGSVGQAASFDCDKATTETEIAICSDPELSAWGE